MSPLPITTIYAKDPALLSPSEVLSLKPGTKELKQRLMWEYPKLTDPNELYSGMLDVLKWYPNDQEWINLFGKLLRDKKRRIYAMIALGKYKSRKYEKQIYAICIDKGKVVWEAFQSLFEMNSPYLLKAVEKAKSQASNETNIKESRKLLETIEKKYYERQRRPK
ncbi:MAG: hypothetical protein HYS98_02965 [Deltaproteobacteria bacterium]|nr:hypothetical protein [Deltaproteobacteria bacterium]